MLPTLRMRLWSYKTPLGVPCVTFIQFKVCGQHLDGGCWYAFEFSAAPTHNGNDLCILYARLVFLCAVAFNNHCTKEHFEQNI